VFVSYHHANDQAYYDAFSKIFHGHYEAVYDNSLDRIIDSDNLEYVLRNIRENYITGTSSTVVLCGSETAWRKFVDWEIKATLDRQHGLIGVWLPTNPLGPNGGVSKPDRLQDNIDSGYAVWTTWADLTQGPRRLQELVELGISRPKNLIDNSRPLRKRNG